MEPQGTLNSKQCFLGSFVENHLNIYGRVYFWALFSMSVCLYSSTTFSGRVGLFFFFLHVKKVLFRELDTNPTSHTVAFLKSVCEISTLFLCLNILAPSVLHIQANIEVFLKPTCVVMESNGTRVLVVAP